jgi:hypothetical protein
LPVRGWCNYFYSGKDRRKIEFMDHFGPMDMNS